VVRAKPLLLTFSKAVVSGIYGRRKPVCPVPFFRCYFDIIISERSNTYIFVCFCAFPHVLFSPCRSDKPRSSGASYWPQKTIGDDKRGPHPATQRNVRTPLVL
jgi:hypothetical protein